MRGFSGIARGCRAFTNYKPTNSFKFSSSAFRFSNARVDAISITQ